MGNQTRSTATRNRPSGEARGGSGAHLAASRGASSGPCAGSRPPAASAMAAGAGTALSLSLPRLEREFCVFFFFGNENFVFSKRWRGKGEGRKPSPAREMNGCDFADPIHPFGRTRLDLMGPGSARPRGAGRADKHQLRATPLPPPPISCYPPASSSVRREGRGRGACAASVAASCSVHPSLPSSLLQNAPRAAFLLDSFLFQLPVHFLFLLAS